MRLELICFLFCAFFLRNYSATPNWVEEPSTTLPTTVVGIENNTFYDPPIEHNNLDFFGIKSIFTNTNIELPSTRKW